MNKTLCTTIFCLSIVSSTFAGEMVCVDHPQKNTPAALRDLCAWKMAKYVPFSYKQKQRVLANPLCGNPGDVLHKLEDIYCNLREQQKEMLREYQEKIKDLLRSEYIARDDITPDLQALAEASVAVAFFRNSIKKMSNKKGLTENDVSGMGKITKLWDFPFCVGNRENFENEEGEFDIINIFSPYKSLDDLRNRTNQTNAIRGSYLFRFPSASMFDKIQHLSLCGCKFTEIPESFFKEVTGLINLTIDSNKLLREIPTTIGNCKQLKSLILTDNNLELLPRTITNLTSLQRLAFEDNPFVQKAREIMISQELFVGFLESVPLKIRKAIFLGLIDIGIEKSLDRISKAKIQALFFSYAFATTARLTPLYRDTDHAVNYWISAFGN